MPTSIVAMTHSLEPGPPSGEADKAGRTPWRWRFEDTAGAPVNPESGSVAASAPSFPSQSDAESWIGEEWHGLLEEGVDQVTLLEGDRVVYAAMSLHPPG